jgi:oligosaccharide translocation protein RFT1
MNMDSNLSYVKFDMQVEKQVLAEGSKIVLVAVQNQYNQGVYGLVANLGSLLVRTLFQPLEEIAFAAFSR